MPLCTLPVRHNAQPKSRNVRSSNNTISQKRLELFFLSCLQVQSHRRATLRALDTTETAPSLTQLLAGREITCSAKWPEETKMEGQQEEELSRRFLRGLLVEGRPRRRARRSRRWQRTHSATGGCGRWSR
jgi:hypothetical protein